MPTKEGTNVTAKYEGGEDVSRHGGEGGTEVGGSGDGTKKNWDEPEVRATNWTDTNREGKRQVEVEEEKEGLEAARAGGGADDAPQGNDARDGLSREEETKEASRVLKRRVTNRELLVAALSEPDSGAFLISQEFIVDGVRQNDKRPAMLRFSCPDEWVKNLAGYEPLVDYYFAIRVPREFCEYLEEKPN